MHRQEGFGTVTVLKEALSNTCTPEESENLLRKTAVPETFEGDGVG